MAYIIVEQRRSLIGSPKKIARVARSMGLGRIGKSRIYRDTRALRGQVRKISHLVAFKLVDAKPSSFQAKDASRSKSSQLKPNQASTTEDPTSEE